MKSTKFENIQLTWFGHASFQIKSDIVIYIDPYVLPETEKIEKADLVLATHDHYDHCSADKIERLKKTGTIIITTDACAKILKRNVRKVKPGDEVDVKGCGIKAVPSYNINKPFHPVGQNVGYIITIKGYRIYHAGDTDFIPEMAEIKTDIALLPIGGTYTMNIKEAAEAAAKIKPKVVIPMHYNYLKGLSADANLFKEEVHKLDPDIEVRILG